MRNQARGSNGKALETSLKQLKAKSPLTRMNGLQGLSNSHHPNAVQAVVASLLDSSADVRSTAAECLGAMKKKEGIEPLIHTLSDPSSEARMRAVESLGVLLAGCRKSPPALVDRLRDSKELVRIEVAEALGAIGDRNALSALFEALTDPSPLVRSYVAGAIGVLGNKRTIAKLEEKLALEKSDTARVGYYQALYTLGKHEVLPELLKLLHGKDYRVRCSTADVLAKVVANRSNAASILLALRKALRREPTVAGKDSIRSSIKAITRQYPRKQVATT